MESRQKGNAKYCDMSNKLSFLRCLVSHALFSCIPECSKTRKKLRVFARKNPNNPAVKHWIKTEKWEPPDEDSLITLIGILKKIIDK